MKAAVLVCLLTTTASVAFGTVVGGGGSTKRDCLVVFDADVNTPSARPRHVKCTDGDPACDSDGLVNGVCQFAVAVCANSTFEPTCTLAGVASIVVDHALDNGDPKFDPELQSLQTRVDDEIGIPGATADDCTAPVSIRVPIKGPLGKSNRCGARRKKIKLESRSQVIGGKVYIDKDRLKLTCLPQPAGGCDPLDLFGGTFERIQRQIFNQSCARGGCHDSQSFAADLVLDTGAAYGNLINKTPTTSAAFDAGWLRTDVVPDVSGSTETSFLYRKISGDLPDATYGERMPRGGRKLHKTLREIIRLWIEAGAPQNGWVAGTF